jgi:hypothetical protein
MRHVESPVAPPTDERETVHTVLAAQARGRATSELWTSAVGGGINTLLIWTQFPSLRWLAGGFAAVAAYGAWGLLDRRLSILKLENDQPFAARAFLVLTRGLAAAGGWMAAAYAVATFLSAALGGLSIPGR